MAKRHVLGRQLIELLCPLLDIETSDNVRRITLHIAYDELVTAEVEFLPDTRILDLNWPEIIKGKPSDGSTD